MHYVRIGGARVSRFILGSNPFSGFSHQSGEADQAMVHYYTAAKIKETIREAESLGVNTLIARTDLHVMRVLLEYKDEGGEVQWFAQTCPGVGSNELCIGRAAEGGATGCHIHGGVMDHLLAQQRLDELPPLIELIRERGMLAGIAGHNPAVFEWARDNLDVDYYMCCHYNSAHRDERAEHVSGMREWFIEEDRARMTGLIQTLKKPAIHYKVLAAGRNDPAEAFAFTASKMRENDAVCVGVFTKDAPGMLREDVELLDRALAGAA